MGETFKEKSFLNVDKEKFDAGYDRIFNNKKNNNKHNNVSNKKCDDNDVSMKFDKEVNDRTSIRILRGRIESLENERNWLHEENIKLQKQIKELKTDLKNYKEEKKKMGEIKEC